MVAKQTPFYLIRINELLCGTTWMWYINEKINSSSCWYYSNYGTIVYFGVILSRLL